MRVARVLVLTAAVLVLAGLAPGEASAGDCGFVGGGRLWKATVNGQVITQSTSYHVYTLGSTSCSQAKRWAVVLSYRPHAGALALAWPDNSRTRGYLIQGPAPKSCSETCRGTLPAGYVCRRAPDPPGFDVGPVYCRKAPEPKGYARFYFFPGEAPD